MKLSQLLITTSLITLLPVGAVLAHGGHAKGIEQRLDRQEMRIVQGKRSGALNRHEAKRLHRQHNRVSRLHQEFMQDGRLDKRERRVLQRKLDRVSDNIRALKHNDSYRHGPRHYQRHGGDRIVFSDKGVKLVLRFDNR